MILNLATNGYIYAQCHELLLPRTECGDEVLQNIPRLTCPGEGEIMNWCEGFGRRDPSRGQRIGEQIQQYRKRRRYFGNTEDRRGEDQGTETGEEGRTVGQAPANSNWEAERPSTQFEFLERWLCLQKLDEIVLLGLKPVELDDHDQLAELAVRFG